jgi:hypothetical protein
MKPSSMFLTCFGEWNEDSQTWTDFDVTDMAKCCTNECLNPVNFCYDYCEKDRKDASPILKYRCKQMCEDQRNICLDTCSLISKHVSKEENNDIKCAIDNNCGSHGLQPKVDCILKNKQKIFDCCTKTTIPSPEIDAEKHCKYLESVYLNPPPVLVQPDKDTRLSSLSDFKKSRFGLKSKNQNFSTILIILVIIFGITFLYNKIKS